MRKVISTILFFIFLGIFLYSGYRLYLIPNDIVSGGFTGIGQLVHHFLPFITIGTVNLLCVSI